MNAPKSLDPSCPDRMLEKLRREAVGLDVTYELASGERRRRVYLDSTASTLRLQVVQDVLDAYQPYYANTHSILHFGAKLSTTEYQAAHRTVLDFVNADPERCMAFFTGSGTTAGANRVARALREKRPGRDMVITSIMEHHSNDLPHRKHHREVVHVPVRMRGGALGSIDLGRLEEALAEAQDRVNYVAVTGVSNVTGIVNPIHEVAKLAHRHGALVVVDAAQMAAHLPIRMSGHADPEEDLDVVIFSGHKIYAPGSPGVVVARKDLFAGVEPQEIGGGVVDDVHLNRYKITERFPDREEAGTPNIPGAIGLAAALYAMQQAGMERIAAEELRLIQSALDKILTVPDIFIYGDPDCRRSERAGAISFNIKGVDHALTAAVLNDYHNVSVRNECFCAHPYVREMITEAMTEDDDLDDAALLSLKDLHRGMVRASFGIYNTDEDVDVLVAALHDIGRNRAAYAERYERLPSGDFVHKTFRFDHARVFSVKGVVDRWLAS